MFYQTSMGLIYLIFNQLPFLWDTSESLLYVSNLIIYTLDKTTPQLSILHQFLAHYYSIIVFAVMRRKQ